MSDFSLADMTRPHVKAGPREWLGLAVLALPALLLAMDATVLYLAVPSLTADLNPTATQLLWITDAYGFMIAGFLVTMGTLGDRIGRRKLLMIGAAAFLATSVLAAYSDSPELLIVARGLLGIAGATLMPSTLALISNMFADARERGVAIGIWAASISVGAALGPVAGGILLNHFQWGAAFLLAVPVMVLLLITAPMLLPEHRDPGPGRLDLASVGLSLATVLPIIHGVKQIADGGHLLVSVGTILIGLAVGAVFLKRQRKLSSPLIDVQLFTGKGFSAALVVLLFDAACVVGVYFFTTLYLQQELGLSPLAAGLWLVPSAVVMVLSSIATPMLTRRMPAGRLMTAGLCASAAGLLLLVFVDGAPGVMLGMTIVYLGQGPIMALGTEMVVGAAAPEKAGSASALSETSMEFGMAFGVAVLGSVGMFVNRQSGFTTGMAVVAGIGAVITLGLAILTRTAGGSGSATDRSPA
jgi:MFS transporter, DHA2 family, multidrug resistance protein